MVALLISACGVGVWLWWSDDPETPLERLGLERIRSGAAAGAAADTAGDLEATAEPVDPEQLAFLERQKERASELAKTSESLEAERGVTLTDRGLIRRLGGHWRLDIGGRQIIAEFAPLVVDRVRRGSLLVELYPVHSRHLPPFYTVFELPDKGTFIAFRAADGSYRLVLEDVRFHGPDLYSYRLGRDGRRHQAYRLRGSIPPTFDLPPEEQAIGRASPSRKAGREESGQNEPVQIIVEPPPPASEMWRVAAKLRDAKRFHSLHQLLERMRNMHPEHRGARRWSRRVDGWIRDQREEQIDAVRERLEDLSEAIRDHDLEEIFEQWDDRPDASTHRFFTDLLARHENLEARIAMHSVDVEDGIVDFSATVTLEGWSGRRRDREIIPHRWRGQLQDEHFVTPFR